MSPQSGLARLGALARVLVREQRAERRLSVHTLIDTSASMRTGEPVSKWRYACWLGLASAYCARLGGDAAELHGVAGVPRAKLRLRQIAELDTAAQTFEQITPEGQTDLSAALGALAERSERGLGVIVSDLLSVDETFWRQLSGLRSGAGTSWSCGSWLKMSSASITEGRSALQGSRVRRRWWLMPGRCEPLILRSWRALTPNASLRLRAPVFASSPAGPVKARSNPFAGSLRGSSGELPQPGILAAFGACERALDHSSAGATSASTDGVRADRAAPSSAQAPRAAYAAEAMVVAGAPNGVGALLDLGAAAASARARRNAGAGGSQRPGAPDRWERLDGHARRGRTQLL